MNICGYEMNIIRSARKTLAMEVRSNGELVIRAPRNIRTEEIIAFVSSKQEWLETHLKKAKEIQALRELLPPFTMEDIQGFADKAVRVIPPRVAHYAPLIGVTYGRITIRNQRTRWGSCSSTGNLNFNCLLMLTPPEVIDSVVVHELCHRLEMNHSARFYQEVYRVFPEYDKWNDWLKTNGPAIMARMTV